MADKVIVSTLNAHNDPGKRHSCERRSSKRLLCSDLVQLSWRDEKRRSYREVAILENLSLSGVGLFTGVPLPLETHIDMAGADAVLRGKVKQCAFRENGYVVGIELDEDSKWAQEPGYTFLPQHLLDVSLLDLD